MSFSIILQKNNSPINKIGKNITNIIELNGSLRNEIEILNPEILIETSEENIKDANYLSIPSLNRKYFIQEIESYRSGIWIIKAHIDVLDTYSSEIKNTEAVVLRQENIFNLLVNDGVFKCKQNSRIVHRVFPSGLGAFNYVLLTQGGN